MVCPSALKIKSLYTGLSNTSLTNSIFSYFIQGKNQITFDSEVIRKLISFETTFCDFDLAYTDYRSIPHLELRGAILTSNSETELYWKLIELGAKCHRSHRFFQEDEHDEELLYQIYQTILGVSERLPLP